MIGKIARFAEKYKPTLGVMLVGLMLVGNIFFLSSPSFSDSEKNNLALQVEVQNIPKLSEIKQPRIDPEAAYVACPNEASLAGMANCTTLPIELWILLLSAYLFLLIFNLGFTFGKRDTVQWFWEVAYTGLALTGWFWWDRCRTSLWFPLYVLTMGVLIYLAYLYFFEKNLTCRNKKQEVRQKTFE